MSQLVDIWPKPPQVPTEQETAELLAALQQRIANGSFRGPYLAFPSKLDTEFGGDGKLYQD
jgi:hypothetical protein